MIASLIILCIISLVIVSALNYRSQAQAVEALRTLPERRTHKAAFVALPPVQTDFQRETRKAAGALAHWALNQANPDLSDTFPELPPVSPSGKMY